MAINRLSDARHSARRLPTEGAFKFQRDGARLSPVDACLHARFLEREGGVRGGDEAKLLCDGEFALLALESVAHRFVFDQNFGYQLHGDALGSLAGVER